MLIRIIGVTSLILVLIITFIQTREIFTPEKSKENSTNEIQQDSQSESSDLNNSGNTNTIIQGLSGIYPGSSKLFSETYDFPESTLELRQDGSFIFSAAGFDTSVLNIQEIQLDGQYPFVVVQAFGFLKQDTKGILADIQGVEVSFTKNIDGEAVVLNQEESLKIMNILESNEILVPSPSSTNPLIVPVSYDTVPSVTLQSIEGSPIFVTFDGYSENQVRTGLTQQNQN